MSKSLYKFEFEVAFELDVPLFESQEYETLNECDAAATAVALMLIHLQDNKLMLDYTNYLTIYHFENGEWFELDNWDIEQMLAEEKK